MLPSLALLAWTAAVATTPGLGARPCPPAGGMLTLQLDTAAATAPAAAVLTGSLAEASCDAPATLATTYAVTVACDPNVPATCATQVAGLHPGRWIHRLAVIAGEAIGRQQARQTLVLDASAGAQRLAWPWYRSVHTVGSLDDALDCTDCLRAALAAADVAAKPALVQFAPTVVGTIRLAAALPALAGGAVAIDGYDVNGVAHQRTIDGAGRNTATLRITSAGNHLAGLRIANAGGDSDTLLVEGPAANGNRLDHLAVLGRAQEACQIGNEIGCVLDGACVVPSTAPPRGDCGDDGIAVRNFAGAAAPNVIYAADVRGARDKGIKASEGGVVRVERSLVTGNTDGGIQATLSGQVVAFANEVRANRGTLTANGISANGASAGSIAAAALTTRGNLLVGNALRGLSVRSLSIATLRDDFACGNGTAGRGDGFGLAVFNAAAQAASVDVRGLAAVHNLGGGVVVGDTSGGIFGTAGAFGANAFAFNGVPDPEFPVNFRNQTAHPLTAVGNHWEHCGTRIPCDQARVRARDVYRATLEATVAVTPALATPQREAPQITAIEPPFADAGDLVRLYGSGFDAIDGAGASCDDVAAANRCRPVRGNCVFIDRQPAEVVAVTPTMLVVRAPFTCVAPVAVAARTARSRGFGRARFCTAPPTGDAF